jgi:predicted kinase
MGVIYTLVGLPGHGKSFIAEYISNKTGAKHINVDEVRHEITDGNPQYSQSESRETYDKFIKRGKRIYKNGGSVVLDGTFNISSGRKRVKEIAGEDVIFIKVECDESTAKDRLADRDGISDAEPEVYDLFRFKPLRYDHVVIDNNGSKENTKEQIQEKIL